MRLLHIAIEFERYKTFSVMTDEPNPRFTFYYWPTSYYSAKAALALYEKKVVFSERLVDIRAVEGAGEGSERWYMEINPTGLVPVLGDRDKFIPESEDIIDYIDKEIQTEPRLVPSIETDVGKDVDTFRKLYIEFPFGLTHGVWYHPDLSPGGARSHHDKAGWDEYNQKTIAFYQRLAVERPDLKEAYLKKAERLQNRWDVIRDKPRVREIIDSLLPVLDQTENQLKLVREREGDNHEAWLCSTTYTAADISLTILLGRLHRLGLESLFLVPEKHSALCDYWERVKRRPSYVKLQEKVRLVNSSLKN